MASCRRGAQTEDRWSPPAITDGAVERAPRSRSPVAERLTSCARLARWLRVIAAGVVIALGPGPVVTIAVSAAGLFAVYIGLRGVINVAAASRIAQHSGGAEASGSLLGSPPRRSRLRCWPERPQSWPPGTETKPPRSLPRRVTDTRRSAVGRSTRSRATSPGSHWHTATRYKRRRSPSRARRSSPRPRRAHRNLSARPPQTPEPCRRGLLQTGRCAGRGARPQRPLAVTTAAGVATTPAAAPWRDGSYRQRQRGPQLRRNGRRASGRAHRRVNSDAGIRDERRAGSRERKSRASVLPW
jgi:hypothetical protein